LPAAGPGGSTTGLTRGGFHGAQYIFQARFVPQVWQAVAARSAVAKAGFAAAALTGLAASRFLLC
jgi:2-methylisocitrate lyase-like PEP mutase family enzyme